LPPLRGSQLLSTQFDFVPVAMVLAALALYLWGVQRANRLRPRHPWSHGKTAGFIGGLVATSFAIFSFVGVYDGDLFWDHMVQHLLLIMVAAPLFAIASPIDLFWRASTGPLHEWFTRVLRSRTATLLGHPGVAFVAYAVAIPLTHLTVW
jgi:cytochrome c oxidase assembly factor CtaG